MLATKLKLREEEELEEQLVRDAMTLGSFFGK